MVLEKIPRLEDLSVDDLIPDSPATVKVAATQILKRYKMQIKRVWVVKSTTSGYNYLVFELKDGTFKGTCPDAFFRRNPAGELCKHCEYVKEHEDELFPIFDIERIKYGMNVMLEGVSEFELLDSGVNMGDLDEEIVSDDMVRHGDEVGTGMIYMDLEGEEEDNELIFDDEEDEEEDKDDEFVL